MSGQGILVILLVGLVAGWLAGQIVAGGGLGFIGDIVVGIAGAFIGNWLFGYFHWHLGTGITGEIIHATVGAILLLAVLRLFTGFGGGYGYRRW